MSFNDFDPIVDTERLVAYAEVDDAAGVSTTSIR